MNNSDGLCSRITFGSSINPEFVGEPTWNLIKDFASLPPAEYTLQDQCLVYEVSRSHIIRPQIPTGRYFMGCDFRQRMSWTSLQILLQKPITYLLRKSVSPLEFDRVTIFRERHDSEPFVVTTDASFIDVSVISRCREVINVYYGRTWTWKFQELWKLPRKELDSDRLFFEGPPRYRIELTTPGFVTDTEVTSFLAVALPKLYNQFSADVYH